MSYDEHLYKRGGWSGRFTGCLCKNFLGNRVFCVVTTDAPFKREGRTGRWNGRMNCRFGFLLNQPEFKDEAIQGYVPV